MYESTSHARSLPQVDVRSRARRAGKAELGEIRWRSSSWGSPRFPVIAEGRPLGDKPACRVRAAGRG
ncbi:hypothetical protein AKJ09_08332 [Labilithrix luteola]|uniref:Uncharacterized protein n=1 Tax=Labilithrix luteola TaxID=1391654 RepID=A0A0K1Q7G1_9BACT|nr:hypothetical protein AKJ09_08332 [Labilithrix luteola]